jgi:transcriptional repressor of cell division inhibition gene dicB
MYRELIMLKTDVFDHFQTLTAVAKTLGITKSAVSQWPRVVPRGAAYELQAITSGQLRVDISLYGKRTRKRRREAA